MNNKYLKKIFIAIFCVVSSLNIFAVDLDLKKTELLIAPKCFIENNSIVYDELAYNKKYDMVLMAVDRKYLWQKLEHVKHIKTCGKFLNISDEWQQYLETKQQTRDRLSTLDYNIFLDEVLLTNSPKNNQEINQHQNLQKLQQTHEQKDLLNKLYENLDSTRIWDSLKELSEHYNRSAYSKDGYETAIHINKWMQELAKTQHDNANNKLTVEYINTNEYYKQPSVIAVLGKDLPGDALVISAHMDTNGGGRRPGSDDDGSGSMVVLETAKLLVESNIEFKRPIYFMWYAAEEMGLVGSKIVTREFTKRGVKIDSVLHFDTIGRRAKSDDPTLFLLRDNVDQNFTDYISNLITNNVKVPVDYTKCGYACSDHASWTNAGFTATAAFESSFDDMNPYLHTANDTMEHVSLDNLVNYTKLALAYVVDKN